MKYLIKKKKIKFWMKNYFRLYNNLKINIKMLKMLNIYNECDINNFYIIFKKNWSRFFLLYTFYKFIIKKII